MNQTTIATQTNSIAPRILNSLPRLSDVDQKATEIGMSTKNVALGLGLFSLALGLTEVLFTRRLAKTAGFNPQYAPLLRIFGFREITSGLGLLATGNKKAWMWSRVAGDALDVAFMGYAFANARTTQDRKRLVISAAVVTPIIVMDVMNSLRYSEDFQAIG